MAVTFCGAAALPMACALAMMSCRTQADSSTIDRTPKLRCAEPQHDFGQAVTGDRLAHRFVIANQGSVPLQITQVEKSYSCMAESTATPIPPGGRVQVPVVCDTRERIGLLKEVVTLHSNDPQAPVLRLEVKAQIAPLLAFDTTLVELESAFGQPRSAVARLVGKLANQATLSILAIDEGGPKVNVLAPENGQSQGLHLQQCKGVGTHVGRVLVSTGLAVPNQLSLPYSCKVIGNLTVSPTNPFFSLGQEGGSERVVTIISTRPDFTLRAARVLDGPFSATVERGEDRKAYQVRIRVLTGAIAPEVRGVTGRLALISNDPAEPSKEIPLFAMGAASPPKP